MITNREEVLENALRIFVKMNYEKASQTEIAKACGLSKAGLIYYYPFKQDLFVAVVDKYVFQAQHPENKFNFTATSLSEFIELYVAGIEKSMRRLKKLMDDGNNPYGCSINFYYYHLLIQVRLYYPNVDKKIKSLLEEDYRLWQVAIHHAKANGEIKPDLDEKQVAAIFHQIFFGLSFEQAFLSGLNTQELSQKLHFIYSLIKS